MIIVPVNNENIFDASMLLSRLYQPTFPERVGDTIWKIAFRENPSPYTPKTIKNSIKHGVEYFLGYDWASLGDRSGPAIGAVEFQISDEECNLLAIIAESQRRRTGSQLLEFVEAYAKEAGCGRMLTTFSGRYKVEGFFERKEWEQKYAEKRRGFFTREKVFMYIKSIRDSDEEIDLVGAPRSSKTF